MIESLTEEQIARFSEFVDKWTKIGLCTEPANRKLAEEGVIECYENANLKPPDKIVWCDSPLSQGLTYTILNFLYKSNRNSVGNSVWSSVGDSIGDSVRNSVSNSVLSSIGNSVRNSIGNSVRNSIKNSVGNSVRNSVRNSVGNSVRNSVRNSIKNSVRNSVGNSVRNSVWDSIGNSAENSVWNSVYGQHESWLSFYDYFKIVTKLEQETCKLSGLFKLAENSGWMLPYDNICFISERPNYISLVDNQLHCETGPALTYPDGWSIWSIEGVLVPESVVMKPETQTIKEINNEKNEEVRRIRIERFGIMRYLEESCAKVLNCRRNEVENTYEILTETQLGQKLVTYCPSTGRRYFLSLPDRVETCEQAQRSLWGINCNIIGRT